LHTPTLLSLWAWDEAEFLRQTEGSPIRRIGHQKWQRNIAVALGNAPYSQAIIEALLARREQVSPLVREHLEWALSRQQASRQQVPERNGKTQRLIRCLYKGMPDHA